MSFKTADIRNIAIAGHGSTGKTTLTEHLLFTAGAISRAETVESGKTVSDYTDEEIERKISIHTALTHLTWNDTKINLLDTPGSSDFVGEVVAGFRVAESAVLAVGARAGVQIETIKLWRRLENRIMPRMIFINKMEEEHADFEKNLSDLREKFDATFVPVVVPMGNGPAFKGVINLLDGKAYTTGDKGETAAEPPADMADTLEEYRMALIEAAAEGDDALMEKYFAEESLDPEEIVTGLSKALAANKVVPVLCGSAMMNLGVKSLLDFIVQCAPSPQVFPEKALDGEEKEVPVTVDASAPFSGFVFKTSIDQFSGKLSYLKVVTGCLSAETELYHLREQKKEKSTKVFSVNGKKLDEEKELCAGDVGVLTKIDAFITNDTVCSSAGIKPFKRLMLPQPVHSVAVSASSKKEEDKLNEFIQKAAEQDLTFQVSYDQETKETVISGMGELHINMILDRIREKQKIEVQTRVPKVAYRETITKLSNAEYTHKKQSGGHGQYGRVVIEIYPLERGQQYQFDNVIKGMAVSKGYVPGIEKGLHDAMDAGVVAGYPVVDVGIRLTDGKEHPVDSSEMSFRLASKGALRAAMETAGATILEPVMNLRVFTDEQYLGDILSDLSSRRGRVLGQDQLGGGIVEIDAQVPQAELLRYSIDLRSITSGTASFEMEFDHYSPISGKIAENVIAAAQREATEEE
ncbi:MAG: elongation factor G [Spirochaetales bacterium]|nr:elongation factor G [Spirochaetales bacterium]